MVRTTLLFALLFALLTTSVASGATTTSANSYENWMSSYEKNASSVLSNDGDVLFSNWNVAETWRSTSSAGSSSITTNPTVSFGAGTYSGYDTTIYKSSGGYYGTNLLTLDWWSGFMKAAGDYGAGWNGKWTFLTTPLFTFDSGSGENWDWSNWSASGTDFWGNYLLGTVFSSEWANGGSYFNSSSFGYQNLTWLGDPTSGVPEPATLLTIGAGLIFFGLRGRLKRCAR